LSFKRNEPKEESPLSQTTRGSQQRRKETPLRKHVRVFQRRIATALGLAAVLAGLVAPLLGAGGSAAPAQPEPAAQQFVFDGEQLDGAAGLPVELLDVETLRRIIHAPGGAELQP
jgi:hypothetical protein